MPYCLIWGGMTRSWHDGSLILQISGRSRQAQSQLPEAEAVTLGPTYANIIWAQCWFQEGQVPFHARRIASISCLAGLPHHPGLERAQLSSDRQPQPMHEDS